MEETLKYIVHNSKGEMIYSSPDEDEAYELAQEVAGWVTSDVVEYDENDNGENRIVYSTEAMKDDEPEDTYGTIDCQCDMCCPWLYDEYYDAGPYLDNEEDVVEDLGDGVWKCKHDVIHTGNECTCKIWD